MTARDDHGRTALDVAIKISIRRWKSPYAKPLRDEMTKQRSISALCSVHQRLALAKTVHTRLAGSAACYAWLPYDLLEMIGKFLVPPADESRGSQVLWQRDHLDLDRPVRAMV